MVDIIIEYEGKNPYTAVEIIVDGIFYGGTKKIRVDNGAHCLKAGLRCLEPAYAEVCHELGECRFVECDCEVRFVINVIDAFRGGTIRRFV